MSSELGLPRTGGPTLSAERRQVLQRRIRWLVAATITYNVMEAVIAISEGTRVSSGALIGFGLDSVIEVSSVGVDAVRSLFGLGDDARHSAIGIALAAASLMVMPILSWAERRAGRELGSLTAVADSKQTLLCTYLSAVLLVGLILNGLFGWSWADPVAALVIAGIAVREGVNAWKGDACCAPSLPHDSACSHECACCH
ncbi:cation transporter [Mycobacterium sp. PDNC021]|uniref:cation transporter n=1 Tax=Mycobacterium sp. PDNC021 TaxID=3391399 RepID=UPI003AAA6659